MGITKVMIWLIDRRMAFAAYLILLLLTPAALIIGAGIGIYDGLRDWASNFSWVRRRAAAQKGQP